MTKGIIKPQLDDTHYQVLLDENEKFHFSTGIPFLAAHKGWRRGNVHFVLGSAHTGKSTLLRTLVLDIVAMNDKKFDVGVILSEETPHEFLAEFNASRKLTQEAKDLVFFSEMDSPEIKTADQWGAAVYKMVTENKIDVLFYDNLTTSRLYEGMSVREQSNFFIRIKGLASRLNIPIIVIGHTGGEINENFTGLIDSNHIRGSKTPVNASQFFYIMQAIFIGEERHTIIRVTKHRGQLMKHKLYKAFYYMNARIFGKFEELDFERFREIFKDRNRL